MTQETVFACDALGALYQYNEQLLWANKELLARCDLLEAELAALKEAARALLADLDTYATGSMGDTQDKLAALADAVVGMFAAQDAWARKGKASIADWSEGKALYDTARAEVERLLEEK